VKITSDAPKSFPLVHHLPLIDAGEELVWFVGRELGVVRVEGARAGGFEDELGFGAGLLGFALFVLPPAG
jgi:hypothetical protein